MIFAQMGGGLGDIFNWLFMHDTYASLESIPPDEKVVVSLTCGNPGAQELFRWHPKAAQMEVYNFGFLMPDDYAPVHKKHNFPSLTPSKYFLQENLKFYPGPSDQPILQDLQTKPYIVLNVAAGHPGRSMPENVFNNILTAMMTYAKEKYGLNVVAVGRTYNNHSDPKHNHVEPKLEPRAGLIDLVDKVTVPATLEIIRRSVGIVCCFSAVCLASWYMKKPTLLLYPKDVGDTQINVGQKSPYTFGKNLPTTMHTDFNSYNRTILEKFLDMAVRTKELAAAAAAASPASIPLSWEERLRSEVMNGVAPDLWNAGWKQVPRFGGAMAVELEVGELLSGIVRATKPEKVVETGTHKGFSTLMIASALKRNELGHLYTIDRTDFKVIEECQKFELGQYVTFIQEDSRVALRELSKKIGKIDLVFLDSEHTKLFLREELDAVLPSIRPGTIIAFHDTIIFPEEKAAIEEIKLKFPSWESISFTTSRGFQLMRAT